MNHNYDYTGPKMAAKYTGPAAAARIYGGTTRMTENATTIAKTEEKFDSVHENLSRFASEQGLDVGPAGRRLVEAGLADRNDPRVIAMQEPLDPERVGAYKSTQGIRDQGMLSVIKIAETLGRTDRDTAMRLKAITMGLRLEKPSRTGLATAFGEISVLASKQGQYAAAHEGAKTFSEMTQAGVEIQRSRSQDRVAKPDER
jgi:hypothetical protein